MTLAIRRHQGQPLYQMKAQEDRRGQDSHDSGGGEVNQLTHNGDGEVVGCA